MGISGAFFVAFIGSLLTAVPLSPAGLGRRARGGRRAGRPTGCRLQATTIVLVDRLISVSISSVDRVPAVADPPWHGLSQPIEASAPAG
jgi:hypothetical protein